MKKKHYTYITILVTAALLLSYFYITFKTGRDMPEHVEGELEVHFIDVGQADSALIICDGSTMLIDGGNVADSNDVCEYIAGQGVERLDYVVCTHAHEDHVGGLAGVLEEYDAGTVLSPVDSYDSRAFENFKDAVEKQGIKLTAPEQGETFNLGEAKITVLGPQEKYKETNNTSIVMRIVFGETSFVFTGDAERDAEQDILDAGFYLDSTVLKVGHHGSETSSSYVWLREIMPEYAVISVGEGNSYGHPDEAVLSRLRDAESEVYRTDLQGNIVCVSDGKTVEFTTDRYASPETLNPTTVKE